jgi:predicted RNA-binding protein (virulence factor B family)
MMGYEQCGPTLVGEDNVACIHMSESSAMFHKGKHIDVRVYRLREFVADGVMKLYYINTASQVADTLTKSLPSEAVRNHRDTMAGTMRGTGAAAASA